MKKQFILLTISLCFLGTVKADNLRKNLSSQFDFEVSIEEGIPTTKLRNIQCGANVGLGWLYCDPVDGATEYEFEFRDKNNNVILGSLTNTSHYVFFELLSQAKYNNTYYVTVRAKVGDVWGDYGESCMITTTVELESKIIDKQCGQTVSLGWLYCENVPSANKYKFEFTDSKGKKAGSATTTVPYVWLSLLPKLNYSETYDVTVSLNISNGWTDPGASCSITIEDFAIETTEIHKKQCGRVVNLAWLYCNKVDGADEYEFEFTDGDGLPVGTLSNSAHHVWLGLLPGVQNGVTYNVKVRARIGTDWSEYGNTCQVITSGGVSGPMAGPESMDEVKAFTVYPNPSNGTNVTVALKGEDNEKGFTIRVYNPVGSLIYNVTEYDNQHRLNLSDNLSKGVYIIHIESDGEYQTRKLVIQ